MPVNERQCRKFVQLAKERPQLLLANRHSNADLDIDSELMLLAFTEDDQTKIRGLSNVRYYLLKIRDTKAYQALGYETFEAFGKAEFDYEKSHLYRLADAAEIERSLNSPMGKNQYQKDTCAH